MVAKTSMSRNICDLCNFIIYNSDCQTNLVINLDRIYEKLITDGGKTDNDEEKIKTKFMSYMSLIGETKELADNKLIK